MVSILSSTDSIRFDSNQIFNCNDDDDDDDALRTAHYCPLLCCTAYSSDRISYNHTNNLPTHFSNHVATFVTRNYEISRYNDDDDDVVVVYFFMSLYSI